LLAGLQGRIAAVLDCGPCRVGVESTVLDLSSGKPVLLRPGGVALEALEAVIGPVQRGVPIEQATASRALRSPGMLVSHYAPALPVRLRVEMLGADEALLAFGPPLPDAKLVFQLSESQNLAEAAARLFEGLHWLDAQAPALGLRRIAAMRVPESGLGLAINDRLGRAAAPRG
jgi:L-threonylcarbamoyladenylate synthase